MTMKLIFIFLMALTCAHAFLFKLHQILSEKPYDDSAYHSKSTKSQPRFGLPSLFHKLKAKPNLFEKLAQKNERLAEKFEEKLEKLSEKLEAQFAGKHNDKFDEKLWSLLEEKFNKKWTDPLEILPPSHPKPSYSPVIPPTYNHHHSSPYGYHNDCKPSYSPVVPSDYNHYHLSPCGSHNDCNDDSYGYFT